MVYRNQLIKFENLRFKKNTFFPGMPHLPRFLYRKNNLLRPRKMECTALKFLNTTSHVHSPRSQFSNLYVPLLDRLLSLMHTSLQQFIHKEYLENINHDQMIHINFLFYLFLFVFWFLFCFVWSTCGNEACFHIYVYSWMFLKS